MPLSLATISASAFGRDTVIAASDTDAGAGGGDLASLFGRYLVAAAAACGTFCLKFHRLRW